MTTRLIAALVAITALMAVSPPAMARTMTYYLVTQWMEGGNNFCRYSNGTVLNVGYRVCPLSIQG